MEIQIHKDKKTQEKLITINDMKKLIIEIGKRINIGLMEKEAEIMTTESLKILEENQEIIDDIIYKIIAKIEEVEIL